MICEGYVNVLGEGYFKIKCSLNRTVKGSDALPRIEELLGSLPGTVYFSTLDMRSGYHQASSTKYSIRSIVSLALQVEKERTAFTACWSFGLYGFNRLLIGLSNAPVTHQEVNG